MGQDGSVSAAAVAPRRKVPLLHRVQALVLQPTVVMLLHTGIMMAGGLLFWIVAARHYSESEVGLAVALLNLGNLVAVASKLGLDAVLPKLVSDSRFSPRSVVNTSFAGVASVSVVICFLLLLVGATRFSPFPGTLRFGLAAMFVANATITAMSFLMDALLIGEGKVGQVLARGTLLTVGKLVALYLLSPFAAFPVFVAWVIAAALGWSVGIYQISQLFPIAREATAGRFSLRRYTSFLGGNYAASLFAALPGFGLPVLVGRLSGPADAAVYYTMWMAALILLSIPQNLQPRVLRALSAGIATRQRRLLSLSLLTMLILGAALYLALPMLLAVMGASYVRSGQQIFVILSIGMFVAVPPVFGWTWLRANGETRSLVGLSALYGISSIVFALLLIPLWGASGGAVAWVACNAAAAAGFALINRGTRRAA